MKIQFSDCITYVTAAKFDGGLNLLQYSTKRMMMQSYGWNLQRLQNLQNKNLCSPYTITEHRVPELMQVLDSQPAGDVSHKPDGRLPLLSARPAVKPATTKRAATNFAVW